ncbi:Uncharacterised protein [Vibrio cholerae]|uniref:Uncharacterized protein n=1 Tax=Vibrio cholerae TaxID=666 RepID=A0A655RMY0_VIBCL|nr:Uncharacterised protein [Vibrio cholerae]CRZ94740.1 Uncharacterised protein [Vibrio cholerae]CRZ96388.1 Uncharacterised protein [Vibrio cholerae]CSA80947.1 Uncharacterised protein [Vibrio cholerae]CSA94887.1 Uncharacterised protein [Vibrio cholerae]
MNSYTITTNSAPSGSIKIPSQRRIFAKRAVGRTVRSKGTITVGPVTTVKLPNISANGHSKPSNQCAAVLVIPHETSAPTVTMLHTVLLTPRISLKFRVRLPSNKITATASETSGKSKSPIKASGFNTPNTGPAKIPANSKNKMAGRRNRQANH